MIQRTLKIIIVLFFLTFLTGGLTAQMMGPQDPGNGPEAGDPPLGGGAAAGEGTLLLISMGLAYSGFKISISGNKQNKN